MKGSLFSFDESGFLRSLLFFGLIALALVFLYQIRMFLMPFVLAAVLAYVANPLVSFLEARGVRRESAVMLLYLGVLGLFFLVVYWIMGIYWEDLPRFRYQWPEYVKKIDEVARQVETVLAREWPEIREKDVVHKIVNWAEGHIYGAVGNISSLLHAGLYFILAPFAAFYFLRGSRGFFQNMLDACPGRWVEKFLSVFYKIDEVMGNYLRGLILEAAVMGFLAAAGLKLLKVDHAGVIGGISAVCNFVPYLGAFVGGTLSAAVAFLQYQNFEMPFKVLLFFAGLRFFDDWFLQPAILRHAVNLHPVTVLFALLCGGELGGFWGLLLAVPVAGLLQEIVRIVSRWYMSEKGFYEAAHDLTEIASRPWIV